MSGFELIILDFDGTFTDLERAAIPFMARYREGLARITGARIDAAWERACAVVREDPDAHGYRFDGRIVAPSHADPYILSSCVSRLIVRELGRRGDRADLEPLFHEAYRHADTVFRPDAAEVAEALLARGAPVYVVTNSRTDIVTEKLGTLLGDLADRLEVRGDARKFDLVDATDPSPRFDAVAESSTIEDLARPVYLRRGRYFDVLAEIWRTHDIAPERTLVCGDIFELDLALPAALGASVHLVGRQDTPAWERRAVRSAGGSFSAELRGILDRITS